MSDDLSALTNDVFRARFRGWLETNYPQEWRQPITFRLSGDAERRWLKMLYDGGWRAPAWPKKFGGLELGLEKQLIYHEELEAFKAARFLDSGAILLGPILMKYGTASQQAKELPAILRGEVLWCQGYSEPNAGSDLASLKTSAVLDGTHFVVNGQKIWTTLAAFADRMFILVRTSKSGRKQAGISFLMLDMKSPGVTVRPIMNLAGEDELCEVFFQDVRVPVENLIHEIDQGWEVAKTLLGGERIANGAPTLPRQAFEMLEIVIAGLGLGDDPAVRDRQAELLCDLHDLSVLYAQVADTAIRGETDDAALSIMKVLATELFQRISEEMLRLADEDAGAVEPVGVGGLPADLRKIYMIARPSSIYAGANEVQRNIIARMLLGAERRGYTPFTR
jgi:alkylation response protein AidB-like acyl-CoA dehydrogenase